MVSMAVNKTQFQRVRLVKPSVAVLRLHGGQTSPLRVSVLCPPQVQTHPVPCSGSHQLPVLSPCLWQCHPAASVTQAAHTCFSCAIQITHTATNTGVATGGTPVGPQKKIKLCVITYSFCSRATHSSTNASFPEQETMHFQITLQSSNEDKI